MLDNIKKWVKPEYTKGQMIEFVLGQPEHNWIKENSYINAHMTDFLERLPTKVLKNVFYENMTIFVPASGRFACTVASPHQQVVMIFPELFTLLTKTFDGWAKAVLAHEVGHLYLNHSKVEADPMEAQVDADEFACEMGYLDQLEEFLHDQPDSIEKRVRLSFISSYYFSQDENQF